MKFDFAQRMSQCTDEGYGSIHPPFSLPGSGLDIDEAHGPLTDTSLMSLAQGLETSYTFAEQPNGAGA